MVAEINALDPTEISRLRVMMTRANPDAMINIDTAACIKFIILVNLRKLAVPNDNPMKTNTMTIAKPYDKMKFSGLILW